MTSFKEKWQFFWKNVWESFKSSLLAMIMFFAASSCVFLVTLQEDMCGKLSEGLNFARWAWIIGAAVVAMLYNGFIAYANGGQGYEMLVSGNMKRMSAERLGTPMKMSSHKEEKEYRDWKGFVSGAWIGLIVLLSGLFMGANGDQINLAMADLDNDVTLGTGTVIMVFIVFLLSGWSVMPFFFANMGGFAVSYYWSCFLALAPILVTGIFYIVGAYGRRNKAIKAQEQADAASRAQQQKPQKINYGGLPGTKPNKKKK
ncbi:MAG: hypothetical protein IJX98_02015 [Clostridia bacterium]|nr:hypothetical protein [Clostridia bacterium]